MCECKREEDPTTSHAHTNVPALLRSELAGKVAEPVDVWSDFPLLNHPKLRQLRTPKENIFSNGSIEQAFWYVEDTKSIVGQIRFLEGAQGLPRCAHGGAIATAFDNAFGVLVWRRVGLPLGVGCPALQLNISYKRFVSILRDMKIVVAIDRIEGKKVFLKGQIRCPTTGEVLAAGEGLFYRMADSGSIVTYSQARELFGENSKYSAEQLLNLFTRKSKL